MILTVQDLFTANYRDLILTETSLDALLHFFIHPFVPIILTTLYLFLSVPFFEYIRTTFNISPKGPLMNSITITHSLLLGIYSGWTFLNTSYIMYPIIIQNGFYSAICDYQGKVWFGKGLGFWISHFYLSKYMEFLDTWIIILKGKKPSFLQTFHHSGIVLIMWTFVITHNSSGGFVAINLNSFIHTLMYTYYVLAAYGYRSPLKKYLTQAQIIQFVIGIIFATPTHFLPECSTPAQSLTLFGLQLFGIALILLFGQFYMESYKKPNDEKNR